MTSSVASKNLYELLGNDPDQDPELRTEPPPVEPVDKPLGRSGKRNANGEAPMKEFAPAIDGERGGRGRGRGGRGRGRGRGGGANEQAFFDKEAGSFRNREKPTDEEGFREERRGGRGGRGGGFEGRGGRRGRGYRDDRHSRTVHSGPNDQQKQAEKGWGEETGIGELKDEQAGEAIALEESKDGATNYESSQPVNADGEAPVTDENAAPLEEAEPEPEDKTKSYTDYLAELAQKKLQLGGTLAARQANEGGKDMPEGKTVAREETEYFVGGGGKARRERERKTKEQLVLDHDYAPRQEPTFSGGRGGGRGRGRGEGGFRGEGRGEGRGRGFRGRGEGRGGGFRGGRGGANLNVTSDSDFPGLA